MKNLRLCKYIDELLLNGDSNNLISIFLENGEIIYSDILDNFTLSSMEKLLVLKSYTQFDEIDKLYRDDDADYVVVVYEE